MPVAPLTARAASGSDPGPDFKLSRLCLFSVTHKTDTITVAVSKRSGSGWTGVCWTHDYAAKGETQSWWRRDGDNWKVQGKPIPGNSTATDVQRQHYNIPAADVPVLLDELAKMRKKSPMPP